MKIEIVCLLDKSGSMHGLEGDVIGGINTLIEEQQKVEGEANLMLVFFDTETYTKYDRVPLGEVVALIATDYRPHGATALLDAIGNTAKNTGEALAALPESERPDKVLFVIQTDGQENSSKEYTKDQIATMIKHQEENYNWQYIYHGANQDSFSEAGAIGIQYGNTVNFASNPDGLRNSYVSMNTSMTQSRTK